jgi:hypothetical protein
MVFTAEQRPSLPRLPHACTEESQLLVPWIPSPAPAFCAIPQLGPQRFEEEKSVHITTYTC